MPPPIERGAVLEWLRGELRQIAMLRSALIFRRIARHNARHMLFSLAHWVVRNGYDGLLIDLDIRRYAVAKRGMSELPGEVYYTKAAVMDAYEVLRQLVDATDELSACCVTLTAAPEFLTDDTRGLATYTALHPNPGRGSRPPPRQPFIGSRKAGRPDMSDNQILRRRAIEALRAGVPNRDAVSALGTSQKDIERRFLEQLDITRDLPRAASNPGGILIGGDFGSGKSHLLEHLQHIALERRFVVSKIVISKETPLHDTAKVYRAAIEAAVVANRRGNAFKEIAIDLKTGSESYLDLFRWANDGGGLNARFAATLYLFENLRYGDQEFTDQIVSFWAGDAMRVGDLRAKLRESGAAAAYN